MSDCVCGATLQNTGTPDCPNVIEIARHLILVPELAANGTENRVLAANGFTPANLTPKLDASDRKDRFYPILNIENVEDVRGETVYEEMNSGKRAQVRKGFRTFTGFILDADPVLLEKLQSFGCTRFGAYVIDKNFSVVYRKNDGAPTYAYPILIDQDTFDVQMVKGTDSEVPKIMISFQFRDNMKDSDLRLVSQEDTGLSITDIYGLLDVDGTLSSITTAGFTIDLATAYGDPVENLLLADFSCAEITPTPGAVALTSVTESSTVAGQYAVVFTSAQTSADELRLTISKDRYDFTAISDGTLDITIP
jgi:hypothetical protein